MLERYADKTTQFLALNVLQVLVGTIFSLAKVNTVPRVCNRSPFRTASRHLDSLACIESITDAYSQYFVIRAYRKQ